MIKEMHKSSTLIDSYGKQTMEDNRRKRAPCDNINRRKPSVQYRGSHNMNNLNFISTMDLVAAVHICSFRGC